MEKTKPVTKLINKSFIKEVCHSKNMCIAQPAIDELARHMYSVLLESIQDAKEQRLKTVLRRNVLRKV